MYLAKNNKNKSKFSFSVSKKVCKSAVDRNRLRRQGYSIISKHIKEIKEENLFIFVFKKGSSVYGFERLEQEILGLLSLSGVLI